MGWDVEDSSWSGLCCCCCRGIFICITCRGQMRVCWADQNQRNQSTFPSLEVGRGGGGAFSVPRPLYPSSFTWLVAWFSKTMTSDNLESFAGWQRRTSLRARAWERGQNDVSKLRLENRQVRQGRQGRRVRSPANT